MVIYDDPDGKCTKLYGPGLHLLGYGNTVQGTYCFGNNQTDNIIISENNDLSLAKVDQGSIMHFECGGNNILIGPGIHLINQPMNYIQTVQLDSFYIEVGIHNTYLYINY